VEEVAVGGPEEHRGEEDEDEVEENVGGGRGLGHGVGARGWVSGILPLVVVVVKKYFPMLYFAKQIINHMVSASGCTIGFLSRTKDLPAYPFSSASFLALKSPPLQA
jgi:hypothetical protein